MRMFESVSVWIIIFSLIIACFIGSFTHWIIGVIVFIVIAGKAALIGIILDTISGSLEYHHDREDDRVSKTLDSVRFMEAERAGRVPDLKSVSKIINIRR